MRQEYVVIVCVYASVKLEKRKGVHDTIKMWHYSQKMLDDICSVIHLKKYISPNVIFREREVCIIVLFVCMLIQKYDIYLVVTEKSMFTPPSTLRKRSYDTRWQAQDNRT